MRRFPLRMFPARSVVIVVFGLAALLALALSVARADPAQQKSAPQRATRGRAPVAVTLPATAKTTDTFTITGHLLANGAPVAHTSLSLHPYNGTLDGGKTAETTTDAQGAYTFENVPMPEQGFTYRVFYGPNQTRPEYVYRWFGPLITDIGAGMIVSGGDLDIADVHLVSPPIGATVPIPTTFTWQPRANPTDQYRFALIDAVTNLGCLYPPGPANNAYTFTQADTTPICLDGFMYHNEYMWYVAIDDTAANNSYGESYEARLVTFTDAPAEPTVTPTATPTVHYPLYLPLISREVAPATPTPAPR